MFTVRKTVWSVVVFSLAGEQANLDSGMPSVVVCIPVKCILKIYISVQCRDGKGVWLSVCGTRRIVCLYWLQIESRKRPLPRASVCFPTYPTH